MTMPSPDGQRIPPAMGAQAYKTFQVVSPISTHFRAATCAEADCPPYLHGWRSTFDEATELGASQAHYVRHDSGRKFLEYRDEAGMTVFDFEAGQKCFGADRHRVSLERPEIFIARDGDWRGNPLGTDPVRHTRPEHWVEDFALHQQRLNDAIEKG